MSKRPKVDLKKLSELQKRLADSVSLQDKTVLERIKYVVGVDQSFMEGVDSKMISVAALLDFKTMETLKTSISVNKTNFPYIPGYLMFREGESAVNAVKKLISRQIEGSSVILVDGSGIAHPRRCGLACYIAIKTNTPAIGITKHRLVGDYEEPKKVGEATPLTFEGEKIGYVLKTCKRCRPIFISPGSYISPDLSLDVVRACLRGFKLPEPVRIADKLAKLGKLGKLGKLEGFEGSEKFEASEN